MLSFLSHPVPSIAVGRARYSRVCACAPSEHRSLILPPPTHAPALTPAPTLGAAVEHANGEEYTPQLPTQPRQSLPTKKERKYMKELGAKRGPPLTHVKSLSFSLKVSKLDNGPEWAYTVFVKATKQVLGKRAVSRSKARQRLRQAARLVFPGHAFRAREYVIYARPEALTTPQKDLISEFESALQAADSYALQLPVELWRRRRSPPPPYINGERLG